VLLIKCRGKRNQVALGVVRRRLAPVPSDDRQLDGNVDRERPDDDERQGEVRSTERESEERVPLVGVQQARCDLDQGRRDEDRDGRALQQVKETRDGRCLEQ
jgi:hypothetical protein